MRLGNTSAVHARFIIVRPELRQWTCRATGGSLGARASLVTAVCEAALTTKSESAQNCEVACGGSKQRRGQDARLAGVGNECESLINVVTIDMPKLLSGMTQRGVAGCCSPTRQYVANSAAGEEASPYPAV
jgi:hypothetical protein